MASPIIGITTSTETSTSGQLADRLGHKYVRAVATAGGLPLLIPNVPPPDLDGLLGRLDGLLLSGGRDVAPERYGVAEHHPATELDLPRDELEISLIRAAFARGLPILGICRGIQSLNVALGGTLYQDVPTERPGGTTHRQSEARQVATHSLRLAEGSLAARALGTTSLRVNTFHHQAVREPAPVLAISGYAEDGLIEAVEVTDGRFVLGVQYHPEEMVEVCEASARLFRCFVSAASGGQW